jgi:hypothetical protein
MLGLDDPVARETPWGAVARRTAKPSRWSRQVGAECVGWREAEDAAAEGPRKRLGLGRVRPWEVRGCRLKPLAAKV